VNYLAWIWSYSRASLRGLGDYNPTSDKDPKQLAPEFLHLLLLTDLEVVRPTTFSGYVNLWKTQRELSFYLVLKGSQRNRTCESHWNSNLNYTSQLIRLHCILYYVSKISRNRYCSACMEYSSPFCPWFHVLWFQLPVASHDPNIENGKFQK
jgi:hypothetical protein